MSGSNNKGMENMRGSLVLILSMVIFLILIGVVVSFVYNMIAVSDSKIYDDNNKYIDPTLPNPDVESNYKDTYNKKLSLDGIALNIVSFFNSTRGVFVIIFLCIFLFGMILRNWKMIIEQIKNMFD